MRKIIEKICSPERDVSAVILRSVLRLASELVREGREGTKIGTIFVAGDEENVLKYSRPLILDPLFGHPDHAKKIEDPDMRETIKELSQLDGAFIISSKGVVLSAARYLEAPTSDVNLPTGLGARHMAAAAISLHTKAVAVVVSTSSVVRVFDDGRIVGKIIP